MELQVHQRIPREFSALLAQNSLSLGDPSPDPGSGPAQCLHPGQPCHGLVMKKSFLKSNLNGFILEAVLGELGWELRTGPVTEASMALPIPFSLSLFLSPSLSQLPLCFFLTCLRLIGGDNCIQIGANIPMS